MSNIIIDPAHGGHETRGKSTPHGHRTATGAPAKDLTLWMSQQLAQRLPQAILTRTSDTNLSLGERREIAKGRGGGRFLSIHVAPRGERGAVWIHEQADEQVRAYAGVLAGALGLGEPMRAELALLHPRGFDGVYGCIISLPEEMFDYGTVHALSYTNTNKQRIFDPTNRHSVPPKNLWNQGHFSQSQPIQGQPIQGQLIQGQLIQGQPIQDQAIQYQTIQDQLKKIGVELTNIGNPADRYILAVDDETHNHESLKLILNKVYGANPQYGQVWLAQAHNGIEGVEAYVNIKKNGGKLIGVIMDVNMPRKNGVEATKEILEYEAKCPPGARPMLAFCTSCKEVDIREDCNKLRFALPDRVTFLSKPTTKEELGEWLKGSAIYSNH